MMTLKGYRWLHAEAWCCLIAFCVCWVAGGEVELPQAQPYVYELGQRCGVDNGCLSMTHNETDSASDNLGGFQETRLEYTTTKGTKMVFSSRVYYEGMQVFKQEFPSGLRGVSTGDKDAVSACYPRFTLPTPEEAPDLRFITPGGNFLGWSQYSQGSMKTDLDKFRDGETGGMVVLFQKTGEGEEVSSVVLSALTQSMATNVRLDRDAHTLDWGVQGQAENLPPGYTAEVILRPGKKGITDNILGWGAALRTYHSTSKMEDPSADYLTYYTDNGAAHYYNPHPYDNYRDAMMSVYNYSVKNNLPIRRLQLDSWWYYKGVGNGVKNWTVMPETIPGGIGKLSQATGWPIAAHNRYFSSDTDYAIQNGGPFPFTVDNKSGKSLPLDKNFWDHLFDYAKSWGLVTYEQDWLDRQYMGTSALHTNVTLGASWLDNMGRAAEERGLNVQYCMSLLRHVLHSPSLSAVTQLRVSGDYLSTPDQWRIGVTSLLAHALALRPFKDVFWTSHNNSDGLLVECEVARPSHHRPGPPAPRYTGRANVAASGKVCVAWAEFGWDDLHHGEDLHLNFCRNPHGMRDGAFCYTRASFSLPEEQWEWEYCDVPKCDVDCYTFNGVRYIGGQSVTKSGHHCVDWAGKYGITGAVCRNPTSDVAPWCYVTEDHKERDYCNNKCLEATEPNPDLQAAVSTLSAGPLGVGDRAENLNIDLIMKSCNAEGRLLHPSKPLTVVDGYFFSSTDYREVWTGYSTISDYQFGIIFLAEIEKSLNMTPSQLNLQDAFLSPSTLVFSNYPEDLTFSHIILSGQSVELISCSGPLKFCLLYTSPRIAMGSGALHIMGELGKWTPMSPNRITTITASVDNVNMTVRGIKGESVTLTFSYGSIFSITCDFKETGVMSLNVASRNCEH